MALVTLAEAGSGRAAAVVGCNLLLPRVGAWTADLELDKASTFSGKVELRLGPHRLAGTVDRAMVIEGRMVYRVVAGGGGLRAPVVPKHFTSPTVAVVLRDALGDVGELVSPAADQAVLGHQLQHWTKVSKAASREVRCLLRKAGAAVAWRHLPDGTVWAGRETWPESAVRGSTETGRNGANDSSEIALVDAEPIWPGTTLGGRRVDDVELRLTGGRSRATVWWHAAGETAAQGRFGALLPPWPRYQQDRVTGAFAALAGVPPEVDHLATYRAKLLRQHPNLRRVDVQPADPRLPPMSNIPLKVGVPGLEPVLTPGHQVLVGWEGGDQEFPYAWGWEAGELGTVPLKETFHAQQIELGGHVTPVVDGLVTGRAKDPYTGLTQWALGNSSRTVGAKQ